MGIFSSPKAPKAPATVQTPPLQPIIREDTKAVQEAAAEAAAKRNKARGYRSTILRNMVDAKNDATGGLKSTFGS